MNHVSLGTAGVVPVARARDLGPQIEAAAAAKIKGASLPPHVQEELYESLLGLAGKLTWWDIM